MRTFDTPTTISTVLDIPAGRIQLIAADRTNTTVEVPPADASKGRDVKAAERTAVDFTDGAAAGLTIHATTAYGDIVARSL